VGFFLLSFLHPIFRTQQKEQGTVGFLLVNSQSKRERGWTFQCIHSLAHCVH
jgi:hypothetical protein